MSAILADSAMQSQIQRLTKSCAGLFSPPLAPAPAQETNAAGKRPANDVAHRQDAGTLMSARVLQYKDRVLLRPPSVALLLSKGPYALMACARSETFVGMYVFKFSGGSWWEA